MPPKNFFEFSEEAPATITSALIGIGYVANEANVVAASAKLYFDVKEALGRQAKALLDEEHSKRKGA